MFNIKNNEKKEKGKIAKKLRRNINTNVISSKNLHLNENKNTGDFTSINVGKAKRKFKIKDKPKFFIFLGIFILLISLLPYLIYNHLTYSSIKKGVNDKSTYISSNLGFKYIDKGTLKYVKDTTTYITFKNKDYDLTFLSSSISRKTVTNINYKKQTSRLDEFKGLKTIIIDFKNIVSYNRLESVTIKNISNYLNTTTVDIYKIDENSKPKKYISGATLKDTNLTFKPDEKCMYVIVYVPIKNIQIDINSPIEVGVSMSHKLDIKITPENSTYKKLNYISSDDEIVKVSDDAIINGLKEGKSTLTIVDPSNKVSKSLDIVVSQFASSIKTNIDYIKLTIGNSTTLSANVEPQNSKNNELVFSSSDENIAKIDEKGKIESVNIGKCNIIVETNSTPKISKSIPVEVVNKSVAPVTTPTNNASTPTYKNGILIVNKQIPLPSTYNPGVNNEALAKFNEMKQEASKAGHNLKIVSGFRSYSSQAKIYSNNVAIYGKESTDAFSAMPGHSEHQTGLAFDIKSLLQSYGTTPEGIWLANNCHKFGFIIRYQKNKESITGYMYEPWHIRYIGTDHATKMFNSKQCLEEYLGLV